MDLDRRLASVFEYGELLTRLWHLYSAYEHALSRFDWSRLNISFEPRRRAHWLVDDMLALGLPTLPRSTLNYSLDSIEAATGCLYVLEGSSLGGQVIQRRAIRIPGVSLSHGVRFFSGHGEKTASLWNEFLVSLNRIEPEGAEANAIERSAARTFDAFTCILSS